MRLPTVSGYDGRHDSLITTDDNIGLVEWQPGDGTRYYLVDVSLGVMQARALGAAPEAHLVSLSTDGQCWTTVLVNPGAIHHLSYFEEKVTHSRLSPYTCKIYTALINLVLGSEAYGLELAHQLNITSEVAR